MLKNNVQVAVGFDLIGIILNISQPMVMLASPCGIKCFQHSAMLTLLS